MKINNKFIALSSLLLMVCACVEEDTFTVEPQPGSEVQFGLSLDKGLDLRTVYGTETSTGFPVYWVNGDRVLVASPQCSIKSAEYMVTANTATQNYADALSKVGEAGVQWGTSETADFYSIYPSAGNKLTVSGSTVSASLSVAPTQHAAVSEVMVSESGTTRPVFYAQPREMGNVIMYAHTPSVLNGDTVYLKYKPFSTVIEFTLNAPSAYTTGFQHDVTVQSITLTAPAGTNIAGDFSFSFPQSANDTPSIVPDQTTGKNAISLHFLENNQYVTKLTPDKRTLKAKMCLMPIANVANLNGWVVTVETNAGTFTKTLPTTTGALVPGKVHKIVLPTLNYASEEWVYNLNNWIPTLPDYTNIYLTELSLPGAWYAGSKTDDGYQATQSITTLWNAGIRAFAVETKCITPVQLSVRPKSAPTGIVVSGTADNASLMSSEPGTNTLGTGSGNYIYKEGSGNIKVQKVITDIIDCLRDQQADQTKKPEYAVLVLSYADGGKSGTRSVDYGAWLELLHEAYNGLSDTYKSYIYSEDITPNTTIANVLNKLIIKINIDTNIAEGGYVYQKGLTFTDERTYLYGNNLPALFSYNPYMSQLSTAEYSTPLFSKLYWKSWDDDYRGYDKSDNYDFTWCFSSANRTQVNPQSGETANTTIPTYAQRQEALNSMMQLSRKIYDASTHDVWFYFNAGGTQTTSSTDENTSATDFAKVMNKWLLDEIQAKVLPSPLGLVMFNQCTGTNTTYLGADIIDEIIKMNNKFYLKHAGDANQGTTTQPTPASNAAYAVVGGDAF